MTYLNIDLAAEQNRSPSIIGILLLVMGLAATGLLVRDYLDTVQAHAELERRMASLRLQAGAVQQKHPDADELARQSADDQTRQRLDQHWSGLVAALNQARGKQVGFLALEADGRHGKATLKAEARDYDAMLSFYQKLQASKALSDVILSQHLLNDKDGKKSVGFTMRMDWGQKP